jgi:hypothetical protein
MWFRGVVAVVDAELGCLLRLTSYIGAKAVKRVELENLMSAAGDFQVDLPGDLPVTEAGPLDDLNRSPQSRGQPPTLGGIIAREAAAGAARAAKNLLGRLGPHDPV